jgi:hypothetical protein
LDVSGNVRASGSFISNNKTGITQNITVKESTGGNCQMNFVGGILVGTTCAASQ